MSFSLSPFAILGAAAATFALVGACTNPVILASGASTSGTPGGTAGSAGTTGTGAAGAVDTTGAGAGSDKGPACPALGGMCKHQGDICDGTVLDPFHFDETSCGVPITDDFCCLAGTSACMAAGGTCVYVGDFCDGHQGPAGSCGGAAGVGCCVPEDPCHHPCEVEDLGSTECAGSNIETCTVVGSCVGWVITSACPPGDVCSGNGACIAPTAPPAACTSTEDLQCGCGCGDDGKVECSVVLPATCNTDMDCSADSCLGVVCHAHTCLPWVCNPGMDSMCNESASMSALAGACNGDGTCACNAGFTRKSDGKCG